MLCKSSACQHAAAYRHIHGGKIAVPDDGEHFRRSQLVKSVSPAGPGRLRRISPAPIQPVEQVADLKRENDWLRDDLKKSSDAGIKEIERLSRSNGEQVKEIERLRAAHKEIARTPYGLRETMVKISLTALKGAE